MIRPGPTIAALCLTLLAAVSLWLAFAPPPTTEDLVPFTGEVITLDESKAPGGGRRWSLTVHSFPPAMVHREGMPGFDETAVLLRAGTWVTGLAEWTEGESIATCWALETDRRPAIDYEKMLAWHNAQRGFGVPWLLVVVAVGSLALAGWTILRKSRLLRANR